MSIANGVSHLDERRRVATARRRDHVDLVDRDAERDACDASASASPNFGFPHQECASCHASERAFWGPIQ